LIVSVAISLTAKDVGGADFGAGAEADAEVDLESVLNFALDLALGLAADLATDLALFKTGRVNTLRVVSDIRFLLAIWGKK